MQLAKSIKSLYGYNQIYLATDEPINLQELSIYEKEFQFYFQENSNSLIKGNYKWSKNISEELTNNMLVDLFLLSECSVLVGAQRSMFGWLASRLILGKGNEKHCPFWIGDDTSNKYGWWNGSKPQYGQCV